MLWGGVVIGCSGWGGGVGWKGTSSKRGLRSETTLFIVFDVLNTLAIAEEDGVLETK